MPAFHVGWRAAGEAERRPSLLGAGALGDPPFAVAATTSLKVVADNSPVLEVVLAPARGLLQATATSPTLHYFRLADGTVKPLPPEPNALTLSPGDAYVAVTPGAIRLAEAGQGGPSATIARFIHLRDYFNADKLAAALLEHLLETAGPKAQPVDAGVLAVEAR